MMTLAAAREGAADRLCEVVVHLADGVVQAGSP